MKVDPAARDRTTLKKIVGYCDQIDETKTRFGATLEALSTDRIYLAAAAMCVLQIGELTAQLTDEFRERHADIPWHEIKGMRNIAAHRYGEFSAARLWATIESDINPLRDYCKGCIAQFETEMGQSQKTDTTTSDTETASDES
jgi:uncharacterized protein with HEPN domain